MYICVCESVCVKVNVADRNKAPLINIPACQLLNRDIVSKKMVMGEEQKGRVQQRYNHNIAVLDMTYYNRRYTFKQHVQSVPTIYLLTYLPFSAQARVW